MRTELTTTQRAGVARFTYPAWQRASLSVDAAKAFNTGVVAQDGSVDTTRRTIEGKSAGKVPPSPRTAAQQSGVDIRKAGDQDGGASAAAATAFVSFDTSAGTTVTARVGISFVSLDGALANRNAEAGTRTFDQVRTAG